jgi:integrase
MSLKVYRRGKIWHYRGTVAGRRLRSSTSTEDKTIAQRIAAEVEAKTWREHLDGSGATVTFAQCAIVYRAAEKDVRFLEKIEDYWKDTLVKDITKGAIKQSARVLYPDAKGATRNRQVIVPTQAIINFAAELGWCSSIKVTRFPVATKTKQPATIEWVRAFTTQADEDGLPHLAALCLFMFGTGARRGEACDLKWSDVDFNERTATIRQTKVDDTRIANLQMQVVVALANIPSSHNPDTPVFKYVTGESVGQVWKNVCDRAGIARLSPHSCRHGFATTMLQKGVDPKTVAKTGGWKDVATVMKYYAHAMSDPTITDVIFDAQATQPIDNSNLTNSNKKKKSK